MTKVEKKRDLMKKVRSRGVHEAVVHIKSGKNVVAGVSDLSGNTIYRRSGGTVSTEGGKRLLKNTQKRTPWAANKVLSEIAVALSEMGIYHVHLIFKTPKGIGYGRDASALMAFHTNGIRVLSMSENRGRHAGCRQGKQRSM